MQVQTITTGLKPEGKIMNITVKQIVDLFSYLSSFNIYVLETDETFNFNEYSLPLELEYIPVISIDDPLGYDKPTPFTINVSEVNFNNYNAFKEEFKDNMG